MSALINSKSLTFEEFANKFDVLQPSSTQLNEESNEEKNSDAEMKSSEFNQHIRNINKQLNHCNKIITHIDIIYQKLKNRKNEIESLQQSGGDPLQVESNSPSTNKEINKPLSEEKPSGNFFKNIFDTVSNKLKKGTEESPETTIENRETPQTISLKERLKQSFNRTLKLLPNNKKKEEQEKLLSTVPNDIQILLPKSLIETPIDDVYQCIKDQYNNLLKVLARINDPSINYVINKKYPAGIIPYSKVITKPIKIGSELFRLIAQFIELLGEENYLFDYYDAWFKWSYGNWKIETYKKLKEKDNTKEILKKYFSGLENKDDNIYRYVSNYEKKLSEYSYTDLLDKLTILSLKINKLLPSMEIKGGTLHKKNRTRKWNKFQKRAIQKTIKYLENKK
jgi:hypothetical protein